MGYSPPRATRKFYGCRHFHFYIYWETLKDMDIKVQDRVCLMKTKRLADESESKGKMEC
jgi:hypothetical protein